ncbi:C40 family peptidase [Streptomyces sp. NBC_00102]|uniref:C40 family peptidase n=1 Tax=Streptomyces sp. NBC_00102 TaxID=2975652 RepID=UPI0022524F1B|nr:C40 family peptidase [Streptomyces sp. NBC_00102]MCX5399209.1 C40 family peptidase [Streptomyces sp. NBC_00102]
MAAHRKSAHRKPKQRLFTGSAARSAAALALAGAATATAATGSAQAEPRLTTAQVKAKVDQLYRDAEAATERYNGAREKAGEAARSVDALRDEAARRTALLNDSRHELGSLAAAQYRSGGLDPALQLLLTSDPDEYLERSSYVAMAGDRQAGAISGIRRQIAGIDQVRARAEDESAVLADREAELARHKKKITSSLADARKLLHTLTAAERAGYEDASGTGGSSGTGGTSAAPGAVAAPNSRAAQAVAFAYGALGKPYVWGATGPSAYDCSGLTQAAWQAAGVSLPRTTYTQINAGQRVSRSQLAPGDLVFFYSGISHVGLYIGDGKMIHAPHPGAPIRIAPIDQMPFAGATRVA